MSRDVQDSDLIVERGPGWLFVRLVAPVATATSGDDAVPPTDGGLADRVWSLLRTHHTQRLVLECAGIDDSRGGLAAEIARLSGRLRDEGGTIRVCGLPASAQAALAADATVPPLPSFANRTDAVVGRLAPAPRPPQGDTGSDQTPGGPRPR
jgi:hypothetical protein